MNIRSKPGGPGASPKAESEIYKKGQMQDIPKFKNPGYGLQDPNKKRLYHRAYCRYYYLFHKSKFKEYYVLHKSQYKEHNRNYRQKNLLKLREYDRQRWIDRTHVYKSYSEFTEEQKEKSRTRQRRYYGTAKGKLMRKTAKLRREAKQRSCRINDLTNSQLELLLNKITKCEICGKPFTKKKRRPTLDHIIPIAFRGNHTLLNTQIICNDCNIRKSDKPYTLFNDGQLLLFLGDVQ